MSLQRKIKCSFKLGGILWLIVTLLLCAIPVTATAEEPAPAASKTNTAPCKDLKPFNNIDELLYQFYINLDSDCLFTMSVAELEKIWGIKILSDERVKPGQSFYQLREGPGFEHKPHESEKDAFYVEIGRDKKNNTNVFSIKITNEYYEKHATLFPDGNYPKLIPKPMKKKLPYFLAPLNLGSNTPLHPKYRGVFDLTVYTYYWLNSERTSMIFLEGPDGITGITMGNRVPHYFLNENAE